MKQSRRSFLQISMTALAHCIAPSMLTTACLPERRDPLFIDFIGNAERFGYFRKYFRKIKKVELVLSTFEKSATNNAAAVFLDGSLSMKPTHAILLMEQGKDILSSYPLARGLSEYNSLQEYRIRHGRKLGLINPLLYYSAVTKLKEAASGNPISRIMISCNPLEIEPGYIIEGITGPAQLLHGLVSYFSDRHPVSVVAGKNESGQKSSMQLDYTDFHAVFRFDPLQTGWTMDIMTGKSSAVLDHTGLLAIDDEVRPRIEAAGNTWELAMIRNLEDFTNAVRSRSEPMVSSLEGLASIILNRAFEKSLETGEAIRL